jgi:hydrogenase expression/formation protein HypE
MVHEDPVGADRSPPSEPDPPAERPLPTGKLSTALLTGVLASLPAHDPAVRLGPSLGEDAAAIDVAEGTLVAATDPITLTSDEAGRYAVLVNANDVAVTGVAPRWFLVTLLFPTGTTEADVRALFATLVDALDEVGASLVGGHSEVTPAVRDTVVVGQMLGLAPRGGIVTTGGANPGDVLVQVGPAPVEGAAVLAAQVDGLQGVARAERDAAGAALDDPGISVVEAALLAGELGATAMHDPTEGGLAAGLHELAHASQVALHLDAASIAWFAPGLAVCAALDCDPWATLASGCLLATFPGDRGDPAVERLLAAGHPAAVVGRVGEGRGVTVDGRELPWPERDELARRLEG